MKQILPKGMALFAISAMIVTQSLAQSGKKETKVSNDLMSVTRPETVQPQAKSAGARVSAIKKLEQVQIRPGNYVVVDVIATNNTNDLIRDLEKVGMKDISSYGGIVSGLLPISSISLLKNISTVKFASPAYKPVKNSGIAVTNGDFALKANTVRSNLGIDGSGITVGVLSDSYNNLGTANSGVASGELPGPGNPDGYDKPVNVLEDIPEGGSDEGRGMLEIIHDVAPGTELAFHTAFNGRASFANGIIDLAKAGCQIITDDISYLSEPFFQDGIIAQAVDQAVKDFKVGYYSSAGNSDRDSYESKFRQGGKYTVTNVYGDTIGNYILHDFNPGEGVDVFQAVTFLPYGSLQYSLQWDDPFASACEGCPGAKTDIDIFLALQKDPSTIILESINSNIGSDPYEILSVYNGGSDTIQAFIAIGKWIDAEGPNPDPKRIKYINFGDNSIDEYFTPSPTCFGHHNSGKGVGVGAAAWYRTPVFGVDPPRINSFSSVGGIPILFNPKGKRLPWPEYRQNPYFTATDGGNTSFFGFQLNDGDTFPNFFGTSASAPHAAAVAALLSQVSAKQLTEKEIIRLMAYTAIDMDDPSTLTFDKGFDYKTGYGLIQADKAVDLLLKRVGIKPVMAYAECSPDPDSIRVWRIFNPNPFSIKVHWELVHTSFKDSVMAKPGNNIITTQADPFLNLMIISWTGAYGEMRKYAAFSCGQKCEISKSAIAGNESVEPLIIHTVYPNPFVNSITVELYNGTEEDVTITLYDTHGKAVHTGALETKEKFSTQTIDVMDLPNGIYFMKAYTKYGKSIGSYKLIKE